ncbi:MAG TPA: hypothetical protein VIV60_32280 [Polyangiaceae bacterium]
MRLVAYPLGLSVSMYATAGSATPVVFPEAPLPGKAAFAESSGARVRSILVYGDTIYVGGNFSVSQNGVTRTNLAAFDLQGNLKPAFAANPNGIVWDIQTDGKWLFVGGEFTRLGLKKRIAAVDLTTGAVNPRFTVHVEGNLHTPVEEESQLPPSVRSLAVITDTTVNPPLVRLLVGGNFTQINSIVANRSGIAAVDPETGDLDATRFTLGVTGGYVNAVRATATQVFIGGTFNEFQSKAASLGALDLTGIVRAFYNTGTENVTYPRETPESVPKTVTEPLPIIELDPSTTANRLFVAIGGKASGANCAAAYEIPDRVRTRALTQLWKTPGVGGDVQSVHYFDGNVFFGFHDGLYKQPDTTKMAAVDAATGIGQVDSDHVGLTCSLTDSSTAANCWLPVMDAASSGAQGFFGVWEIRDYVDPVTGMARLIVGGEFTQVGGVANTRRLAIFAQPVPPPPPPPEPPPVDPVPGSL